MKISWNNSKVSANRWRCGAILLASVVIVWVAFISSAAQLKVQKHVTSVEMVQAAEGARVTVISDSALNDYEAFRRGDRFYVKIPLAGFSFSQPRFHGNGFDDVQVQKVGDGVVVSFKLQLGASAHVEQHGNRLEVIFTAANRSQYASVAINRGTPSVKENKGNQGNQDRQRDAAGPIPSDGPQVSRQRYANAPGPEINAAQRQPARNGKPEKNQGRTSPVNDAPLASSTPRSVASPTPVPNYPAASSYSPATSTPVTSSKPAVVSANSPNSNLRDWFLANRKTALLAALILAGLLALVAGFFYRGRTTKSNETRVKRPLAQPKYDSKVELDELTASPAERGPVAPITQEATKSEWSPVASKPEFAPATEVAASRAAAFSKSSNSSVAVADNKSGSEEREVFEL
ncbi:MAG TPA: hypothetical protein DC047_04960 [Blastocatellia bacterium]|nr:hypothetical protein [Blastocatellia bacterium]